MKLKNLKNFFIKKNEVLDLIESNKIKTINEIPFYYSKNKEILIKYLSYDGNSLQNLSDMLRDDLDIVRAAISNVGSSFVFASDRLRNDKNLVKYALSVPFGSAMRIVEQMSDNCKNDIEIMKIS